MITIFRELLDIPDDCEVYQMNSKDIKIVREYLRIQANEICVLCDNPLNEADAVLDHDHSSDLIRGTICSRCNSLEGSMKSKWIRSGVAKKVEFSKYLRNLADYLELEQYPLKHPSAKPGPKKLMKSSYNKLKKEVKIFNSYVKKPYKPYKMPDYPKSKRLTKKLKELYERFGIEPKYYI